MSITRTLARKQEAARATSDRQKLRKVYNASTGKVEQTHVPHHVQGGQWWRAKFADLADRKNDDGTIAPRNRIPTGTPLATPEPEMLERPEGMTRQQHRRLFREACKLAGVAWRKAK